MQGKSKHTFYVQWLCLRKSFHLWDDVVKYGRSRQVTDDNMVWHRKENEICKPVNWAKIQTHAHNIWYLLLFHGNIGWRELTSMLRHTYIVSFFNEISTKYEDGNLWIVLIITILLYKSFFLPRYTEIFSCLIMNVFQIFPNNLFPSLSTRYFY
jgi:hypothetical protein